MHHICVCQRHKNTFWNLLLDNFKIKIKCLDTAKHKNSGNSDAIICVPHNPYGSEINMFFTNIIYTDRVNIHP